MKIDPVLMRSTSFRGSKGGGKKGGTPREADDNLRSKAIARVIDILSEGPIRGLVNGLKSVFLDDTPIKNDDDTENFDGVRVSMRNGTVTQQHIKGFNAVETIRNVGVEVKKVNTNGIVRQITSSNLDAAIVTLFTPAMTKGDDKGNIDETKVEMEIHLASTTSGVLGPFSKVYDVVFEGKTTSGYERDYRVDLPKNGAPWSIKVLRKTDDSESVKLQNATYWQRYTEVIEHKLIYPDTALAGVLVDAQQFGSNVPTRSYEIDGLLMQIPSNYNPDTRVYTGTWNGLFKTDWTNNPAWVLYMLLTNKRFGLGQWIKPSMVNKWALYQIAQYCDELVDNGFGGQEPRFLFNGVIQTQEDALKVLQFVASAFRGMVYWGLGAVQATQDRPTDAKVIVSPANVIGGVKGFEYASTGWKSRHSAMLVTWNDPADGYRTAVEVVEDPDLIARYGWKPDDVLAPGCTSRGQARRLGKWLLDSEKYETETVTFRMSFDAMIADGTGVMPGDVILLHDPKYAGVRFGGRLAVDKASSGTNLTLDQAVDLPAGPTYKIAVTADDGTLIERNITNALPANTSLVTLSGVLGKSVSANNMWVITASDLAPRRFRVLAVREVEKNVVEVNALLHDPLKYARVEQGIYFEQPPFSKLKLGKLKAPVSVAINERQYVEEGTAKSVILLSWRDGGTATGTQYFQIAGDGPKGSFYVGTTSDTSIEIEGVTAGDYQFHIRAIGPGGTVGPAATISYTATGWKGAPPPVVSEVTLTNGVSATVFANTSPTIGWKNTFYAKDGSPVDVSPFYAMNTVKVYDTATNGLLRSVDVVGNSYTYPLDQNKNDNAAVGRVPSRALRFEVSVTDTHARTSPGVSLSVTNPVPAAVTPTVLNIFGGVNVTWTPPDDSDYRGTLVWVGTTSGFTPGALTLVYDGTGSALMIPLKIGETKYLRIAAYDSFGKTGLNVSSALAITGVDFQVDTTPPPVPTGLALASDIVMSDAGVAQVKLTATWNPVTADDLFGYDLEIRETVAGTFVPFQVAGTRWEAIVRANTAYAARVRSKDKWLNASAFSATVTHTTVKDTTAPGLPTGLAATGLYGSIMLSWANPADTDFDHVEVWENTSNTFPTATKVAHVKGTPWTRTNLANGVTRFYWLKAVDTSGNTSAQTASVSATTKRLVIDDLDRTAPDVPTGLALSTSSSLAPDGSTVVQLVATWNPNTDADLAYYELCIRESPGSDFSTVTVPPASNPERFLFTGLKPNQAYYVQIRAADFAANRSAWSGAVVLTTALDTTPPGLPGTLTAVGGFQWIKLDWTNPSDADFDHVEIWEASTNNFASAVKILQTAATTHTRTGLGTSVTRYYWLKTVDKSGNTSGIYPTTANFGVSATTSSVSGGDVDTTPPGVPTGLTLSQSSVQLGDGSLSFRLLASWTAPADTDVAGYEVSITEDGGSAIGFVTGSTSYSLNVRSGSTYTVRVRAFDGFANKSAYTSTQNLTIVGDTTAPAAVSGLTAVAGFKTVWLEWNPNTESDLYRYEIYAAGVTTNPSPGAPVTYVTGATAFVEADLPAGTIRHYWVRAVDRSGNRSAWSTRVSATPTAIQTIDVQGAIDQTSFANTIAAPGTGTSLPSTPFTSATPKTFYLTTDKALYVQKTDGSGWIKQTDATLIVGQITAGQIAAGAIGAEQIAAGAITVKHLTVADYTNLVPDNDFTEPTAWTNATISAAASSAWRSSRILNLSGPTMSATVATSRWFPVNAGEILYASYQGINQSGGAGTIYAHFQFSTDGAAHLQFASIGDTITGSSLRTREANVEVPATARYARLRFILAGDGATGGAFGGLIVRRAASGELIVDGTIKARHLIATESIITASAQIQDAIITSAKIFDLDAAKIRANTILADSIQIGGDTLGTIKDRAADPAARVNANTTLIQPGKIQISGSSTLADWRDGTDTTSISGGKIAANSISANKLQIGLRGIVIEDIEFEFNSPSTDRVSWTGGKITYLDDAGAPQNVTIAAGSSGSYTGSTLYVYWPKGITSLSVTTNPATANGPNVVPLAAYAGGVKLVANYGRTVIDGSSIKTGSIDAQRIMALAITGDKIAAGTLTADKLTIGAMSQNLVANPGSEDGLSLWLTSGTVSTTTLTTYNGGSSFKLTGGTTAGTASMSSRVFPVTEGQTYALRMMARRSPATTLGFYLRVIWFNAMPTDGYGLESSPQVVTTILPYSNATVGTGWEAKSASVTAPAGARYAAVKVFNHANGSAPSDLLVAEIEMRAQFKGVHIENGAITADHIVADSVVIRNTAQIENAIITNAKIADATIESAKIVSLQANKITIGSGVTLDDWRSSGQTTIDGGKITANSISANKLEIGSRNVTVENVVFTANAPATDRANWTGGTIRYVANDGSSRTVVVNAGSTATFAGSTIYVIWNKGASDPAEGATISLTATTNTTTAFGTNAFILAAYSGGIALVVNYGKTIIDGSEIRTGTLHGDRIIAGTILGDKIAAGEIQAKHLLITDWTNLVPDGDMSDIGAWTVTATSTGTVTFGPAISTAWTSGRTALMTGGAAEQVNLYTKWFPIDANTELAVTFQSAIIGGSGSIILQFQAADDVAGSNITTLKTMTSTATSVTAVSDKVLIPVGKRLGRIRILKQNDGVTQARVGGIVVRRRYGADLIVDGAIFANHLTTTSAVITTSLQVGSTIITDGHISTTGITAEKIVLGGGVKLSDWRFGSGTTIDGNQIAANTIRANSLVIGMRGIVVDGLQFEHNSPGTNQVSWTAGTITYIPTGSTTPTTQAISAGSATWSGGTLFVYWDQASVTPNVLKTSPAAEAAAADSFVVLCAYRGGVDIVANYGRTIIDGSGIKALTITASQISANAIEAQHIKVGAIQVQHIAAGSITASKLIISDPSNVYPDFDMEEDGFYSSPDGAVITFVGSASASIGRRYLDIDIDAAARAVVSNWFPVEIGADYRVSASAFLSAATAGSGTATVSIEFGTLAANGTVTVIAGSQTQVVSRTDSISTLQTGVNVTSPTSGRRARFVLVRSAGGTGSARFGGLQVRRRAGSTLIVDGAITTNHMTVGSINGDRITSGTINANRITVRTLQADRIVLGGISVDEIGSGAVTAVGAASTATRLDVLGSTTTTIQTVTITPKDGFVAADVCFSIDPYGGGSTGWAASSSMLYMTVSLYRGATLVSSQVINIVLAATVGSIIYGGQYAVSFVDNSPGSASASYTARVTFQENIGVSNRFLRVMNCKR